MSTRRTLLSSALALVSAGAARAAGAAPAVSAAAQDARFAPDDVRRYGLVPNNPAAAAANTAALKSLVAPSGGFRGNLAFPNSTGNDVYYLNDIIPFHDGIHLDLQSSTLHFSKPGVKSDTNAGFIFAVRDFSIENGTVVVDFQMGGGATNAGNALTFGNRGTDSGYFSPTYDSHLPAPMGNIVVRNLRIVSNNKGGLGIYMIGGLNGVLMENIWLDGSGALDYGIYYEFGWATDEPRPELRQTSHAYNMRFSNINISNMNLERGWAFSLIGAYNCWVDGLYVKSSKVLFACSPGESGFYRPWAGVDQVGAKRNIAVRNIVGTGITGTAIGIAGASSKSGGYLAKTNNTAAEQTDLVEMFHRRARHRRRQSRWRSRNPLDCGQDGDSQCQNNQLLPRHRYRGRVHALDHRRRRHLRLQGMRHANRPEIFDLESAAPEDGIHPQLLHRGKQHCCRRQVCSDRTRSVRRIRH